MNLIAKANTFLPGRLFEMEMPTDDEIELFLAYLKEEVTAKQCSLALGRSRGYFVNWTRRCLWRLYLDGKVAIDWHKADGGVPKAHL
jgi:hypothetical protein